MLFEAGKKKLQEMKERGMSDFEIDKASLGMIVKDSIYNLLFLGIGGIFVSIINWDPLLWLGIVVFGALAIFSGFQGLMGLIGDIAALFQKTPHAHLHRIAASFVLLFEACLYAFATFYLYTHL